jgi:site-specific recombinase XerD
MQGPVSPQEAVEEYISHRRHELADQTVYNVRSRLKQFYQWADQEGLTDLRDLNSRHTELFRMSRVRADRAPMTIRNQAMTLRRFVDWAERQGYVEEGLSGVMRVPSVSKYESSRDVALPFETIEEILDHLHRYEFASLRHVLFAVMWNTGARIGALHGLDIDDWHPEDDIGYLAFHHRPETDTPLKLKQDGERQVTITRPSIAKALNAYTEWKRHPITEESGRQPLFTSTQGRVSTSNIRTQTYLATQPCRYRNECPENKEIDTCEYRRTTHCSKCPVSVSPHPIRRTAIMYHIQNDVPKEIVAERMGTSVKTINRNYDKREKKVRRGHRRRYLDRL